MQDDFSWLSPLNPEQRQAVQTIEGPVLVLSGAGTGKTTVLTNRLRYIIEKRAALPFQCLAVTFTNKAADEMKERLAGFIGAQAEQVWLGTFHRICLQILRRHPEKAGLQKGFSILDSADQERLMKQVLNEAGVDLKDNPPAYVCENIQRLKERGETPEKALGTSAFIREIYTAYQNRLRTLNAVDFGDLLLYCVELFKNNPDVLQGFQMQFKYILVDEYQDTNVIQYLWLRLLSGKHRNLCCVGDDDQSVYSWRGADVGNILRFEKDFPDAKIIRLESNYRSSAHILGAASGLIAHNTQRLEKTLRVAPMRDGSGEKVSVCGVWDGADEARFICQKIEDLLRKGEQLKDCAILIRASFLSRILEENLLQYGIAYKMIAGMKFYEREEIRDSLAYLRFYAHPQDDMAFLRVVNKPRRGIGDAAIQALHMRARADNTPLCDAALTLLREKALKGTAKKGLSAFFDVFDRVHASHGDEKPHDILNALLEESGYMQMRQEDKDPNAAGRLENIRELLGEIKSGRSDNSGYETVEEYLEHVSLMTDNDQTAQSGDCVFVMTLHAAKGLEFNNVFLPAWEEGIFPNQRCLDESGEKGLEEERRLAYVGITRAKKRVFISYAGSRLTYNQWQNNPPSRFIAELPEAHIDGAGTKHRHAQNTFFGYKSYTNAEYSYKNNNKERRTVKHDTVFQTSGFKTGSAVYHQSFGAGKVVGVSGQSVQVAFDSGELKKVMADYLEKI